MLNGWQYNISFKTVLLFCAISHLTSLFHLQLGIIACSTKYLMDLHVTALVRRNLLVSHNCELTFHYYVIIYL